MSEPKEKIISDIRGKIEREQKLILGFQAVKRNTGNSEVIQRCNNQIRETQSNIDYLQETMEKLLMQQQETQQTSEEPEEQNRQRVSSFQRPLYSRFDLIKYDCPSLGHKIQHMLQQLQFKLQVENQYREANENISHLYLMDGDKLSSSAAEGGKLESDQRIQLLNKALKKYQGMHVSVELVNRDMEIMNLPKYARKPFSGRLTMSITCIRDIDHIASPKLKKKPESFVCIKIDDVEKARSNASRSGKFNEDLIVDVDKSNEMEIAVYDRNGSHNVPVALAWILLSDISEEIRKKKVAAESGNDGWIPASSLPTNNNGPFRPNVGGTDLFGSSNYLGNNGLNSNFDGDTIVESARPSLETSRNVLISAWVNLEPVGQILVSLSFEKSKGGSKPNFMGALGHHGAIRQKKEEVFEQYGHQFVQKQFYNIMCCALCGEFLRYTGYQCQDCRFLCHKKCYQKVVTKCISKSGDMNDDEEKLNHRIPHRFEPVSNRGTKWCCHCGHILPWGKKNVRKCSECGVMSHAHCTHLVPDFCGMSMEMANQILTTIKSTKPSSKSPAKVAQAVQKQIEEAPPQLPPKAFSGSPQKSAVDDLPVASPLHLHHKKQQAPLPPPPQQPQFQPTYPRSSQAGYQRIQEITPEDIDPPYSSRLPTNNTLQFQPSVEPPQHRHAPPRRPPPVESSYSSSLDTLSQYTPQGSYYNERAQDTNGASAQNPFEQVEEHPTQNQTAALFDSFDYNNVNSNLQGDAAQVPINEPEPMQVEPVQATHSNEPVQKPHKSKRRRRKVGLDDFQFLAVLGKGNFGKVMLAESRHTLNLCAIKVLKKDFIVENEEAESVKSEKQVFLTANRERHPFLLNLHCCFQTENRIYFVMEYVSGGDLMWHIQKSRFSAKRAKFYACEVLLALKYFHDNGIIYRDLKLDNILLTTQGHIKIGDYGLCKENMWHKNTTGTFCGTPEFMAPEIIAGKQYDRSVDWWAFGVLMFQMLLCQSPFKGDDEDDIFNAIEHDDVRYPISMPRQTVLVLQALLTKESTQRLGSSERDALEIMEHPYFQDVNFDDVLNMRIQPPYLPEISSEHDYSNFDQEFTSETPRLTPVETVLTSEMQEQFRGFSHIADDAPV